MENANAITATTTAIIPNIIPFLFLLLFDATKPIIPKTEPISIAKNKYIPVDVKTWAASSR